MNMNKTLTSLLLLGACTLGACSHAQVEKQLDKKLAQETDVKTRADLRVEFAQLIKTAPSLSEEQRRKLTTLRESTLVESAQLRERALRLRAVLVKSVLSPTESESEVKEVKNQIRDVEQQRLHLFFTTVGTVNTILGRWASRNQREDAGFYDQMMMDMMDDIRFHF